MKLIMPMNIIAYELEDLSEKAKEKVFLEHANFWLEIREYKTKYKGNYERAIDKANEMKTPWFASEYILDYCEKEIIREIKANKYLYTENGDILPIQYYIKDNKVSKITMKTAIGLEEEIQIKRMRNA